MKTLPRALVAWIGLAMAAHGEMIDYPTPASISIGDGYDFLTKKWKSSPFANPKIADAPSTADSSTLLHKVETSQDVKTVLDITSDNQFGIVVSGSVSASFFREVEMHQYAMNFVVRSKCLLTGKMLERNPVLNDQAKALLASGDILGFQNLYGDYYVKTIVPGGVFFGLIQIQNESTVETEKQKAKMNAQGPTWSTRNDFLNSSYLKSTDNTLKIQRRISGMTAQEPADAVQMIAFAESFADKVKQSGGTPLKVEIRPFSDLPEYRKVVNTIPMERRQALQRLSDHYIEYRLLLDTLNFSLAPSNSSKFDFDEITRADVEQSREQVRSVLQKIEANSEKAFKGEITPADADSGIAPIQQLSSQLNLPRELIKLENQEVVVFPLRFVPPPKGMKWNHDMSGNSPTIDISALLVPNSKSLSVRAVVTMREGKSDWTTFAETRTQELLNLTGTGLRIVRVSPETGTLKSQAKKDEHEFRVHTNGQGLIKTANCLTDVRKDEDGRIGAKPIYLNTIRVTLERDGK